MFKHFSLTANSFCRLFNLAVDPLQPEQEYYLQPAVHGRSRTASSMCPVGFSFGGDHLWDRFSVSPVDILFNLIFGYSHLTILSSGCTRSFHLLYIFIEIEKNKRHMVKTVYLNSSMEILLFYYIGNHTIKSINYKRNMIHNILL